MENIHRSIATGVIKVHIAENFLKWKMLGGLHYKLHDLENTCFWDIINNPVDLSNFRIFSKTTFWEVFNVLILIFCRVRHLRKHRDFTVIFINLMCGTFTNQNAEFFRIQYLYKKQQMIFFDCLYKTFYKAFYLSAFFSRFDKTSWLSTYFC